MIIAPILSAGRGPRALLATAGIELGVLLITLLLNLTTLIDMTRSDWTSAAMLLFPFLFLFAIPISLGGLVLHARRLEDPDSRYKKCRVCGYDLRATPVRCPECGTLVDFDPDRF
jgi:hypothetical protein